MLERIQIGRLPLHQNSLFRVFRWVLKLRYLRNMNNWGSSCQMTRGVVCNKFWVWCGKIERTWLWFPKGELDSQGDKWPVVGQGCAGGAHT